MISAFMRTGLIMVLFCFALLCFALVYSRVFSCSGNHGFLLQTLGFPPLLILATLLKLLSFSCANTITPEPSLLFRLES